MIIWDFIINRKHVSFIYRPVFQRIEFSEKTRCLLEIVMDILVLKVITEGKEKHTFVGYTSRSTQFTGYMSHVAQFAG